MQVPQSWSTSINKIFGKVCPKYWNNKEMLITSDVIKHDRFLGIKVDTFRRIPIVRLEHK